MHKQFLNVAKHKRTRFLIMIIAITAGVFLISYALKEVKDTYRDYRATNESGQKSQDFASKELSLVAEYEHKNDMANALVHAKKLLDHDPNNQDYIALVASLTEIQNPADGKAYYAKMLDDIRKGDDNPDLDGKRISTYWAAAGLAEKAGQGELAKKYYQKVIEVADRTDGYENDLAAQSQAAIERIK